VANKTVKIAFLFPTLNEEEGIVSTIKSVPTTFLKKQGYSCKVFVVDGGSKDQTVTLAKKAGATVLNSPKKGYGFQYKYALSKIKADYIITGDADGTYPISISPYLINLVVKENLDFISTNRFHNLRKASMSIMHNFGNRFLTILTILLFGINLKDSQSGMWCFKLEKIKELNLQDDDMAFSEEIKIKAFQRLKCKEVGIVYSKRIGKSKLNYKHAFKNLIFLFKLRFEK